MAIQLANLRGATVTTTMSAGDMVLAPVLGADEVIDYRSMNLADHSRHFDAVVDTVDRATQVASCGTLKLGGILVTLTQPAQRSLAEATGVRTTQEMTQPSGEVLKEIAMLIDAGQLQPSPCHSFPLRDAPVSPSAGKRQALMAERRCISSQLERLQMTSVTQEHVQTVAPRYGLPTTAPAETDERGETFDVWVVSRSFALIAPVCRMGLVVVSVFLIVADPAYYFLDLWSPAVPLGYLVAWHAVIVVLFIACMLVSRRAATHIERLRILQIFFSILFDVSNFINNFIQYFYNMLLF